MAWRAGKAVWLAVLVAGIVYGQNADAIISELRAGNYEKARQAIQVALEASPQDSKLWTLDGFALAKLGNLAKAGEAYQRALAVSPDYLPALEGAAEVAFKTSDPKAPVFIRKVLASHPQDQTSHAMLASLAVKRHDCKEAVREFGQSRPLIDGQRAALEEYGSCLVKLQQASAAIPVFQKLSEIQPESERARYNLALVQSLNGQPDAVIQTLKNAADPDALDLLADAYEAVAKTPEAVAALRQAIVTNPDEPRYYVDFANLCLVHGSFQVGVDILDAGLKRKPGAAELYLARGILRTQSGAYDDAENNFAEAERLNPKLRYGSSARGLAELQRNNLNEAESTIRARIQKNPTDAFLRYLLAETLLRKGAATGTQEFTEALSSAEKAISLQPNFTLARDVLSRLYLKEDRIDDAIKQSRLAFEEDPNDQTALYHYILALRKRNKSEDISALTKRLGELREQARLKDAEEHKYSFVEVPQKWRSGRHCC